MNRVFPPAGPNYEQATVAASGTSGSPTALSTSEVTTDWVDCLNADKVVWLISKTVSATAATLTVNVYWSDDQADIFPQGTEAISSGTATISTYQASITIAGTGAEKYPPLPFEVIGRYCRIGLTLDAGTASAYVKAWRRL